MKRLLKWFLIGLGSLLGLVVLSLAVIHFYMGYRLDTVHSVEAANIALPETPAALAEGERLARLRGCMGGCHGWETEGNIFFEMPDGTRVVAPDLGRIAAEYSAVELERAIRHGIKQDGTSVAGIMPSTMFHGLSDADVGAIIAFLRSRSPGETELPPTRLGPVVRAMLFFFEWQHGWNILPAESIDHDAPRLDATSDDPLVRGRYLAETVCTECHGDDLRGAPENGIPSLAIVAAYSREDFGTLMQTGVPVGGRELDLMKQVSLGRFAHFDAAEVDSLHAYLKTLATAN